MASNVRILGQNDPLGIMLIELAGMFDRTPPRVWTIKPTVSKETSSVEEDLRTLSEYPVSALNSRSLCVLAAFNLKISGERVLALLSTLAKVQALLTTILEETPATNTRRHRTSSIDGNGNPTGRRRVPISTESTQTLATLADTIDESLARLVSDSANATAAMHQLRMMLERD